MKIKKAILPVAGFGTRFLPATKAQPKEMLPIFDTPAIQFIVEEAVAAGIEDIIIVTGRGKRVIEDHFDTNFELESALIEKGKTEELKLVQNISNLANFAYVRQPKPLGDGHAILCAKNLIGKNEPVVVLFGDDLVDTGNDKNAVSQLIDVYEKTQSSVILLEKVIESDMNKYGIVDFETMQDSIQENYIKIKNFIEKPKPKETSSRLGVIGKFILTPEIFQALETAKPSSDGEIRLANAFMSILQNNGLLYGKILKGKRFDTGDKLGFLLATLHFALKKENDLVANALKNFLFSPK